jgi:hypothetical protein
MNYSRVSFGALGATVAYFAPHVANKFREYTAVYGTEEGIKSVMPIGLAAMFVGILVLAVLSATAYQGGLGVAEGARFGALIGVFAVCAFVFHNKAML